MLFNYIQLGVSGVSFMKRFYLIVFIISIQLSAQDELKLLVTIHGEQDNEEFAFTDAVGDINGDGFDDFLVSGNSGEYVKLYFGSSPFDTLNCFKFLHGTQKRVYVSDCGKGDLNGDGFNDIIINATYDMNEYGVEIYFGEKDKKIYDQPDLVITNAGYWWYGFRAKAINGDLNGDGFSDLIIRAPDIGLTKVNYLEKLNKKANYNEGGIYIFFGSANMDIDCDLHLAGLERFDGFGWEVKIVGDINDDGFNDFLVSTFTLNNNGKVYLFYGGNEIGFNNCVEFITTKSDDIQFGRFISGLGDINSDGYDDFGIASLNYMNIYLGANDIDSSIVCLAFNSDENSCIGSLSDFNNDGYSDFIIVRENIDIFKGSNMPDTIPDIRLDFWANTVCNVSDINGDLKDEIAFGIGGGWDPRGKIEIYSYGIFDGVEDALESGISSDYKLYQNYPNPFNPATTISYTLPEDGNVQIKIFDVLGREITTLLDGFSSKGQHSVVWNGNNFSSGIYYYSIIYKGQIINKKMLMIQ